MVYASLWQIRHLQAHTNRFVKGYIPGFMVRNIGQDMYTV